MSNTVSFFVNEYVNDNVNKNNRNNIDDVVEEPKINMLEVSSLRKRGVYRGQKCGKDQKTCQ